MKKYLMLIFFICFFSSKATTQHSLQTHKNYVMDDQGLVCQLNESELIGRKEALQQEIFSNVKKVIELEDGYIFQVDNESLPNLFSYVLAEKKCCPFLQQDINIHPDRTYTNWKVSGSSEVKSLLDGWIKEMNLTIEKH